jgi:hypothetical protein
MSRAAVRLGPAPVESPPDWWIRAWYDRQSKIRGRLVPWLRDHARPMTASELAQTRGIGYVGTIAEVRHALDAMAEGGVLRRFERTERHPNNHTTRTYTYYGLAEWPTPSAAGGKETL